MNQLVNIIVAALLTLGAGCATQSKDTAQNSGSTATCHVCRYNNDLGCVCVKVKDNTPRTKYQGTTCYFCSEDCLTAFQKQPGKYLPKPEK